MPGIAFIGGGNMASALIGGMIARGTPPNQVRVAEPFDRQRQVLAQRFAGIDVRTGVSGDVLDDLALLVLAVKPQQMREALTPLASLVADVPAVLSVAAGIRIEDMSRWLSGYTRIMRAMPNTPALIGAGITGLYVPQGIQDAQQRIAIAMLESAGEVVRVDDEAMLDAVTGISASGPAYVFYFLEALERSATELGFTPEDSRKLAYATFDGAIRLAKASREDPATLRAQVTSKGGTTARGIAALDEHRVAEAIVACAKAAAVRARELGDEFGRDQG
ncbi:MAG TPA: pyrroline-5-carboxylate reductase [Casimicrobiaceae bacterium]|nr:pyrroline-5-carboxylate reductase [Casimicrobiaceae bacterium]